MNPTNKQAPLSVKAIQQSVLGSIPPVVTLSPRKAPVKTAANLTTISEWCFLAPSDGISWEAARSSSHTFSSVSTPLMEMPLPQPTQGTASKRSQRKRHLRPSEPPGARPQELLPTQVDGRHLTFACPACHHLITLAKVRAGQKTRCPQCTSAIRAPQPHANSTGHNCERTVEALLHPEQFLLPTQAPRRFLSVPMPKAHHVLSAVAVLLLGFFGFLMVNFDEPANHNSQVITLANTYHAAGLDSVIEAEKIVQAFLNADGWENKARYVRNPYRVGKMMQEYYAREAGGAAQSPNRVTAAAPAHYYFSEQSRNLQSVVEVEMNDGAVRNFLVEFLPSGPKIEWESSVAYAPVSWHEMVAKAQPNASYLQRVSVRLDDYYNHEFNDRSKYLSLYLEDPITGASLGNGYLLRDSADGAEAIQTLSNRQQNQLLRVMIEVQPQPTTAKHRTIQITRFVKSGFRSPEAPGATTQESGQISQVSGVFPAGIPNL
jgi:hypothetical protein